MIRSRGSWLVSAPRSRCCGRTCSGAMPRLSRRSLCSSGCIQLPRAPPPSAAWRLPIALCTPDQPPRLCMPFWLGRNGPGPAVAHSAGEASASRPHVLIPLCHPQVRAEEAGLHARLSSAEAQLQRSAATLRAQEERLSDARRVGAAAAAHAVRSMAALEASAMRALQAADAKATAQLERLRTMQAKVEAAVNTGRSRRLNGRWSA
mmetsp:Transcript_21977/g.60385  ORF Transcript_21977/g.60385 Transcript_21977/m.60385 type:complete len:206 (-) Transcript_21977:764-1381(-)